MSKLTQHAMGTRLHNTSDTVLMLACDGEHRNMRKEVRRALLLSHDGTQAERLESCLPCRRAACIGGGSPPAANSHQPGTMQSLQTGGHP